MQNKVQFENFEPCKEKFIFTFIVNHAKKSSFFTLIVNHAKKSSL